MVRAIYRLQQEFGTKSTDHSRGEKYLQPEEDGWVERDFLNLTSLDTQNLEENL